MIRDAIKITLGIILVLIGIILGFIPILQGWLFGLPGLIILSKYFPSIKKIIKKIKNKRKTYASIQKNKISFFIR